jgi:hypothetical protein
MYSNCWRSAESQDGFERQAASYATGTIAGWATIGNTEGGARQMNNVMQDR